MRGGAQDIRHMKKGKEREEEVGKRDICTPTKGR